MWTISQVKENGRVAFKRNYWTCVIVSVVLGFFGSSNSSPIFSLNLSDEIESTGLAWDEFWTSFFESGFFVVLISMMLIALVIGLCISILVGNVMKVGGCRYFMENREYQTGVGAMAYGFREGRYLGIVGRMFLRDLYIFGWSLLLVIPGIIKSYSYMLVPYILAENPDMDRKRVFELSRQMMSGHKIEAFSLELSFIGWHLLSVLTCGILEVLYVSPYLHATKTEYYMAVKADAFRKGITNSMELPGVSDFEEYKTI